MHSISVSVSGASLPELRSNLAAALAGLEGAINDAPVMAPTPDKEPAKRGRKSKEEKEAQTALANGKDDSNIFADAPTPAPTGKQFTKDDVNAAVQSVLNKLGGAETRKLLGRYGAASTGSIKVEDYPKIIAECEKLAS